MNQLMKGKNVFTFSRGSRSRAVFETHWTRGGLKYKVLQVGVQQTARQVAGLGPLSAFSDNSIWSDRLGQNSATWIR